MSTLPIDAILIADRHRKDLGDIAALAHSIDTVGLLHPPVVTRDNRLVAGERRLAAVRSLGWDEVEVTVAHNLGDATDYLTAERDENTCRLAMKPTEETALYEALLEIERADARKRMSDGGKGGKVSQPSDEGVPIPHTPTPIRAKAQAAAAATGIAGRAKTLDKVIAVKAIAESPATPAPVAKVAADALLEMDATGRVDGAYHRVKLAEQIDAAPKPDPRITEYLDRDPELQAARFVSKFTASIAKASDFMLFPVDRVAELADADLMRSLELQASGAANYLDRVRRARSGLRLVKGAKQ